MKIFNITFLLSMLFVFAGANAQDKSEAAKKLSFLDKNGDGEVSFEEIKIGYQGKTTKQGKPLDPNLVFLAFDLNGDKKVVLSEIEQGPNWRQGKDRLKERFGEDYVSPDSSNITAEIVPPSKSIEEMSLEEFKANFKKNKLKVSEAKNSKFESMFRNMDKDKNNFVDMEELKVYYKGKKDRQGDLIPIAKYMYGYDRNNDNKVTLDEVTEGVDWRVANEKYKKPKE
ncbi:hypothetical protein ACXGQW_02105 [Wenyingzhuangia sp. IMCC45533]